MMQAMKASGARHAIASAPAVRRSSPRGSAVPLRRGGACACGGTCPHCRHEAVAAMTVSEPGDAAERDADERADAVMRMAQPAPSPGAPPAHNAVARKAVWAAAPAPVPSGVAPAVRAALDTPGQPLDRATRAFFEPRFGANLGHVRVHADDRAAAAARSIDAHAFTLGSDVAFAAGAWDPHSSRGRALIAHQLAHTLQPDAPRVVRRKALSEAEKAEDLQSSRLRDDLRLQEAFDNAPVIEKNETSDGVKTLQRALKELGYPLPISFAKTGDADGIFEDETEAQVKQFQRDSHLSDDGKVGRDTLRALDDKCNPRVSVDRIMFINDHRDLLDNTNDWSAAGAKYSDWAGSPDHVVFKPDEPLADAIPISVTAGQTITAFASVRIKGGIAGRTYTVTGRPVGTVPGWTLSGKGMHRDDKETDFIALSTDTPLTDGIDHLEFFMRWGVETFAGSASSGFSEQSVFVTAGPAHNTGFTRYDDVPNVPTFRRLQQAVKFTHFMPARKLDTLVRRVIQNIDDYGPCSVPRDNDEPPDYTCPNLVSVWEMTDHIETTQFQCNAVARYVNAYMNVLGVPEAMPDATTRAVAIFADLEHVEEGRVEALPSWGVPSVTHPNHPDWHLGLLDGSCRVNNFEACVELNWTPPEQTKRVTQYYCGGLDNPTKGFRTPREVLNQGFVLTYYKPLDELDPDTLFPLGVRKRDVKDYAGFGRCPGGDCCREMR